MPGASIAAQSYQPLTGAGLLVNPAAGPEGAPVTVTGGGCRPGTMVGISFRGRAMGVVRVGQPGEFSTTLTIPAGAKSGPGPLTAVGPGCSQAASFTVQAATATAVAPKTHSIYALSEVVTGLVIFGIVLLFALRRSRRINR